MDINNNRKSYNSVVCSKNKTNYRNQVLYNMFKWLKKEKEKNRLRFFTYSVYGCLFAILSIILIYLMIAFCNAGFNFNNMFVFGQRPTVIITGSMEPNIKVNSVVMLEPVEFKDIEVGDIVRYTSYRGFSVLHRVQTKTSSYLTTKGDANAKPDEFVVTADQITGRVTSIHNEFADILTPIFGKFEYGNMSGSIARYGLGFLMIICFLIVLIVSFIVIFEMITTVYFFRKYNKNLINSSQYWVEMVKSKDEEIEIFDKFFESYKKANVFKKILLAWQIRRYYNGLCNIEKEVNKTDNRLKFLNKLMK